jgi:uncharacterized membrane protein required for colicin V production
MSQWTVLDFVFIAITLLSTCLAFYKGLARELISLAALIIGFILAAILPVPSLSPTWSDS